MSDSQKRRVIFFIIVGAAVVLVSLIISLGPIVTYRFGPPDLTATAAALSNRATEVSLAATTVALGQVSTPSPESRSLNPASSLSQNLTWDGLRIDILSVNNDAWLLVQAQNSNNDPPLRGKRMMMVAVQVTNVEGKPGDPIKVDAMDFSLMGNRRVVYDPYGSETSCGVVPDELDGVVAPGGGSISGNICVQVPQDEKDFVLIYERFAGDHPAVYFRVSE
jgi:hypothetical protein